MGIKFHKAPNEVGFPQPGEKYDFSKAHQIGNSGDYNVEHEHMTVDHLCFLNSGNFLLGFFNIDGERRITRTFIQIYDINLKLLSKYEFENSEDENYDYAVGGAIQLKNGNIFTVVDKYYEFNGENINEGPKKSSSSSFEKNRFNSQDIEFYGKTPKDFKTRPLFWITGTRYLEIIEGKILFNKGSTPNPFYIDLDKYDEPPMPLTNKKVPAFYPSKYNPENVFGFANGTYEKHECYLYIWKIADLLDKKEPFETIQVSSTQTICALCEYDEKYILCDTAVGIYIVDLSVKLPVARCEVKYEFPFTSPKELKEYYYMRKMTDGRVLRDNGSLEFINPYNGERELGNNLISGEHIAFSEDGKYYVAITRRGFYYSFKIYE